MSILNHIHSHLKTLNTYTPGRPIEEVARKLNLDPNTICKLASNECPLGPSDKAAEAMQAAIKEMNLYPDGGGFFLKEGLAKRFNLTPDNFILGAGSNEILVFIFQMLLSEHSSIVFSENSFAVYQILADMNNCKSIKVPMKSPFTHDLNAMANAVQSDTRIVVVCNPNNPTGTMVEQPEIEQFVKQIPDDVLIVFDEAYAEICLGNMPNTLQYLKEKDNVLILRTFSKAYGLAGLRIGYGIGPAELIQTLNKVRQPFNTTRMGQIAALAALDDDAFIEKSKTLYTEGRELIETFCNENKLEFVPTVTNFMLIKVGNEKSIFEELQKRGVIVRPVGIPNWIRVSFGTMEENKKFVKELSALL